MAVTFGGIETSFVQRYAQDVQLDLQQSESRLRNIVSVKPDCSGLVEFMDKIGKVSAEKVTSRFADSPILPVKHSRRKVSSQGFDWGTAVEDWDMRRMNYDVIRPYATNAAMAMNRKMDELIIEAAFGTHYGSSDGDMTATTGHAWDDLAGSGTASKNKTETGFDVKAAGHRIADTFHYDTTVTTTDVLSPDKLLRARRRLQEQEVETYDQSGVPNLFIICSAKQIEAMLQNAKVQSTDFNDIHALVTGKVNYFAGFQFIRYEGLPLNSSGKERVLAMHPNALGLCIWADVTARIDELPNKRFLPYVYYKMDMGATRLDEKLMVEIQCKVPA